MVRFGAIGPQELRVVRCGWPIAGDNIITVEVSRYAHCWDSSSGWKRSIADLHTLCV